MSFLFPRLQPDSTHKHILTTIVDLAPFLIYALEEFLEKDESIDVIHSTYPSYWTNHGFSFLLCLIYFPSIALSSLNFRFTILFCLAATANPFPTMTLIAFRKGYWYHNYILFAGVIFLSIIHSISFPKDKAPTWLKILLLFNLQQGLFELVLKNIEKSQQLKKYAKKIAILEGQEKAISRLSVSQLIGLKTSMEDNIEVVSQVLNTKSPLWRSQQVGLHEAEERCVICLDAAPQLELIPCQHKCMCEDCYVKYQKAVNPNDKEEGAPVECPLCKLPITSYSYPFTSYQMNGIVSNNQLEISSWKTTQRELMKLCNYVANNEECLQRLNNPRIFEEFYGVSFK